MTLVLLAECSTQKNYQTEQVYTDMLTHLNDSFGPVRKFFHKL